MENSPLLREYLQHKKRRVIFMEKDEKISIKSVNLHVCGICNHRCKHCFSKTIVHKNMLPKEWKHILLWLKEQGVEKVNFAGGEPLLYPHLDELVSMTKGMGFTTSIVSNGSKMDAAWIKNMKGLIDWIGLSVDSPNEIDEVFLGRHVKGINHIENIVRISNLAHENGIAVKLNITVLKQSYNKDFRPLIKIIRPHRVKVFRALVLKGVNDDVPHEWEINDEQFAKFCHQHKGYDGMVFEDNDDMVNSYLMFDPLGRLMVNDKREMQFVPFDKICKKNLDELIDIQKYVKRGGIYEW